MAVVKIKQFMGQCKDPGLRRALTAILGQIQYEMTRGYMLGPAPTLAAKATGDPDLKTTVTTFWVKSDGIIQTKAATATIDVSTVTGYTPTIQAAATLRIYLLCVKDSDGSWAIFEGASVATGGTPVRPATPVGYVAFGQCKVANTTNPFTFGTTNSDAPGVTFTCSDLCEVPTTILP